MVTSEVDLMLLPLLLFILPLATAVILLLTRDASFRTLLVKGSAAVMMGLALAVAVTCFDEPVKIGVDSELLKAVMLAADFLVILAVCYYAKKFKRYSIALLGLVQFVIVAALNGIWAIASMYHGISSSITLPSS